MGEEEQRALKWWLSDIGHRFTDLSDREGEQTFHVLIPITVAKTQLSGTMLLWGQWRQFRAAYKSNSSREYQQIRVRMMSQETLVIE